MAGVALAAPSCQKSVTGVCTTNLTRSLAVTVRDSVSGAVLPSAVIRASMGTRTDSAVVGSVAAYPVSLAWDAGTYEVTVQAPGYTTWTSTQTVTYSNRACGHLAPLAVTALMQRTP
jgi:uncharacterized protein CbrC (UPF0167 family)